MNHAAKLAASSLILALTLAACGGGGGSDDAPATSSSSAASSSSSSPASSSSSSTTSSSGSSPSSSSSSASTPSDVLVANFQTLASGLTDNAETTLPAATALPTTVNTMNYTIQLDGKLKINTSQALPGSGTDSSWTTGVVQFSNATTSVGKVIIKAVKCPFKLTINHSPSNSTDPARMLRVTFGGNEVYYAGGGVAGSTTTPGYTAKLDSTTTTTACTSGTTDVEAYGWNGTQGSGVRIYDLTITQ